MMKGQDMSAVRSGGGGQTSMIGPLFRKTMLAKTAYHPSGYEF
jgi:hypothetical protein